MSIAYRTTEALHRALDKRASNLEGKAESARLVAQANATDATTRRDRAVLRAHAVAHAAAEQRDEDRRKLADAHRARLDHIEELRTRAEQQYEEGFAAIADEYREALAASEDQRILAEVKHSQQHDDAFAVCRKIEGELHFCRRLRDAIGSVLS